MAGLISRRSTRRSTRSVPERAGPENLINPIGVETAPEDQDISYVPMARAFISLAAMIDGYGTPALAWRLSISMVGEGCQRNRQ